MTCSAHPVFHDWIRDLHGRHTADLSLPEIRRALQALSARYVGGRSDLSRSLDGRGKRAAFALFYAPLHFLATEKIVASLELAPPRRILDLGCGTGCSSAAWSLSAERPTPINGIDRNAWTLSEARWNWKRLGIRGQPRRADLLRSPFPAQVSILAAYAVNELPLPAVDALLPRLLEAADSGSTILIIEPIARRLTPWWPAWKKAFEAAGGQSNEWRFPVDLPEPLRTLDRAARLDHRELTARSLHLEATNHVAISGSPKTRPPRR